MRGMCTALRLVVLCELPEMKVKDEGSNSPNP